MSEFWTNVIEQKTLSDLSVAQFWAGLRVWIERPHLVNRKLLATEVLHNSILPRCHQNLCIKFNENDFQHFLHLSKNNNPNEIIMSGIIESKKDQRFNVVSEKIFINSGLIEKSCTDNDKNPVCLLRKLIPRNLTKFSDVLELVIIDEKLNIVIFWPQKSDVINSAITPSFPYRIRLEDNKICVDIYRKTSESSIKEEMSEEWLKTCVLPKIIKWSNSLCSGTVMPSLSLISAKSYSIKYNYLKEKYAKKYIETWPEISDPLKYVYEDIAIAAYLITIWEKDMKDLSLTLKQTFVDLGCGNGLLVDLLNSEGYEGIGIDVRKRKIWDLYEKNTSLIEKTIEPSDYNLFPKYDWIIGNHSDELTPWIPVIASRSSYKMKVFLLPCCAFTFNGKYERCSPGKTQYQSYLSFIQSLCESMGFVVNVDRLRIPSTRRTCFVCKSRNYEEENEKAIDMIRNDFIKKHSRKSELESQTSKDICTNYTESKETITSNQNVSKETCWIKDFKPRDRVEVAKNCSQLDRKFLDSFVLTVANFLLQMENYICLTRGSETVSWNAGGKLKLSELIAKIDTQTMKGLKNQNGGIQTFLRNHRNVFQITDENVQLNIPVKGIPLNSRPVHKKNRRRKQYNFQEKPCFFFFHHPQGCPLEASDCNFSHKKI